MGLRKKQTNEVKSAAPATASTNGTSCFKIGLSASVEELLRAGKSIKDASGVGYDRSQNTRGLVDGAVKAFQEGRVDNAQAIMENLNEFVNSSNCLTAILRGVTRGSNYPTAVIDTSAVIKLALDKVPEENRQGFLDEALSETVRQLEPADESFMSILLNAGANANAEIRGSQGAILAAAISWRQPVSVAKLLHENGASFEDALSILRKSFLNAPGGANYSDHLERLRIYEEEITGRSPSKIQKELEENVADLTRQLTETRAELAILKAQSKPRPPQPAYPTQNGGWH